MTQVKQIGNYSYNERFCLGEGAFGKVYEGTSKQGKRVAIKRIDKRIIDQDSYLRSSIESEIQILKKFNHPNIVKLEDMILTSNNIYIVTEFCGGGDLRQYLRSRKLSEETALGILGQILASFVQIVKLGVVHRDLKPANVLVHQNTFKICDFGFAKYLQELGKMNKTCVGTPMYMSPQVLKSKPYTNKTDIWSLGVLVYEMMFGHTPWQGSSEDTLFKNITSKPLQIPHCSNHTYNLLQGMLAIDESKRWDWSKVFQYNNVGLGTIQSIGQQPLAPLPKQQHQTYSLHRQGSVSSNPTNRKSLSNPRFCYFSLVQLSLELAQSVDFKEYLGALYTYTISKYRTLIDSSLVDQHTRVLQSQLEQLMKLNVEPRDLIDANAIQKLGLKMANGTDRPQSRQIIELLST